MFDHSTSLSTADGGDSVGSTVAAEFVKSSVRAKDFVERSWFRGMLAIAGDWTAIAVVIAVSIVIDKWWLYPISAWLIGSFQFALAEGMLHEASHYNVLPDRFANDRTEILCGLPFFRTVEQLRSEHVIHHARLGKPEDHILGDYEALGLFREKVNVVWIWLIRPILGYAGWYYCGALRLRPLREGWKIVAFWTCALTACIVLGVVKFLVLYWLVPFYWCCMSFLYWSEISDHYRTATGIRSNLGWINNLLHHNNGYHFAHHNYPAIPWYRLREAAETLTPDEGDISGGFLDTFRALRERPQSTVR